MAHTDLERPQSGRLPSIRKVGIAILENLVSIPIGKEAISELKEPYLQKQLEDQLREVLAKAEMEFINKCTDEEMRDALLDLPLAGLTSVALAVRDFYESGNDSALSEVLRDHLRTSYPHCSSERVDAAVSSYVQILRRALVPVSASVREKLSTQGILAIREDTARIAAGITKLNDRSRLRKVTSDNSDDSASHLNVRHNLPQPDFARFVGREKEVRETLHLITNESGAGLIVIEGEAGVGKSSLALHSALQILLHRASPAEQNPFRLLVWTSARPAILNTDSIIPRPLREHSLYDLYATIAITSKRIDIINAERMHQHALIKSLLAEQKCLIIIDNYDTIRDSAVIQFIKEMPYPSKVLVTSRRPLHHGTAIRLTGMSPLEASELIDQECRRREITVDEKFKQDLWSRTEGSPIAIVWSIARLSSYQPEQVLSDLVDPKGPIAKFCFAALRREIRGNPADALLMSLSVFPRSASAEAVAAVAGQIDQPDTSTKGLAQLLDLSLVYQKDNRYSMPSLTRQFASESLRRDVRFSREVKVRLFKWAVDFARKNCDWEFRFQQYQAVLMDLDNLETAIGNLESLGDILLAEDLITMVTHVIHIVGRWYDMYSFTEHILTICTDPSLDRLRAKLLILKGRHLAHRGNPQQALNDLREAIRIANNINDLALLAEATMRSGQAFCFMQEYDKALSILAQACNLADQQNLARVRVSAEGFIGDAYISSNHPELAKAPLQHAADIAHAMGWERAYGFEECLLGRAALATNDIDLAQDYFEAALDVTKAWLDVRLKGWTLLGLAQTEARRGNKAQAKQLASDALKVFQHSDMRRDIDRARHVLDDLGMQDS